MNFVLILFLLTFIEKSFSENVPKVKIGIKKRMEVCSIRARRADTIYIHYKAYLEDGTEFDNSYARGEPLFFMLGGKGVIKGLYHGLLGMCEGEMRRLVIPPELGYGNLGSGDLIPASSTLIFHVEMLRIVRREDL